MKTFSSDSSSSSHQLTMDASKVNRSCDFCRRRKKKCDNGHPCANCRNSQNTCIYSAPKQRKRRRKTKLETQSNAIEMLHLRISNLESLLLNLTTKLDKSLVNNDGVSHFRRSLKIQNPPTDTSLSESSEDYSSSDGEKGDSSRDTSEPSTNPSTVLNVESSFSMPSSQSSSALTSAGRGSSVGGAKNIHPSVVCILSEKSLLWMKKRLRDNVKMITPLLNLPRAFSNSMKTLSEVWVNNPPKLTYKSTLTSQELICSDPDIVHGLLFSYYNMQFVSTYCPIDQLLPLFRRYFHNQKGLHPVHQFSSSELLLMNVSLALCTSNRFYIDQSARQAYPALAQLNSKSLSELRARCFQNCIVHFRKLQTAHEGLITVQAMILLVAYVEYNCATDFEVFRMFCSSLIKCAQDVKLHKVSTFGGLSPQEGYFRRNLWLYCELLDTELCYRCGDASLIQSDEVTTFTEFDDHIFSVPKVPFTTNNSPTQEDVNRVIAACRRSESGAHAYFSYFTLIYTRIRKANYHLLYGQCNGSKVPANNDMILTMIERANEQMCKLSNLMDESVRPFFYSDPKFNRYLTLPGDSLLLEFPGNTQLVSQLSVVFKTLFFTHLSTLNKVPILFYYKNGPGERVQRLGDLSLESARTVLRMSAYIESCPREHVSSFAGGICFYPLMSYLTIAGHVLHYPQSPSAHNDCLSLIEVSKLYAKCSYEDDQARQGDIASPLSVNGDSPPAHTTRLDDSHYSLSKLSLMDLFTRILLRPVIELMANETDHDYCKEIEGLSDFLNGSEILFPDLFVQDNPNVNFIISRKPDDSPKTPVTDEKPARVSLKASYNNGTYGSPLDFFNSSTSHDASFKNEGIIEEMITQPTEILSEFNANHVMSDSQFYDIFGEDDFMKLLNSQFYIYPNFRLDSFGEEAV